MKCFVRLTTHQGKVTHAHVKSPLSWPLQEQRRKEKEGRMEVSSERRRERRRRLWLFVKNYWHRLVGAAVGWFAWDFYYCESNSDSICPDL